jgi:alanyl-tRNA synthetase
VGDKGFLEDIHGDVIYIIDTKKENNVLIHFTKSLPKHINETFKAVVSDEARQLSASNHSATHLLHQALRTILGTHVEQKGSLVSPKHLRFDFSHFSRVDADQLQEIEDFVNARIRENLPLQEQRSIPMKQAIDEGAMALFGEKYGDSVRAIRFGKSMELCGGIHVQNTSDIWHFKIKSEGAVAAGIRRIEAITNQAVGSYFEAIDKEFGSIKQLLKNPKDTVKSISNLQDENASLKKEIEQLLKDKAKNLIGDLRGQLQEINGIQFLAAKVDLDANGIKNLAFDLGKEHKNLFLVFGSAIKDKALLTCSISKELVEEKGLDAGKVVRELGKFINGGGGGQKFYATAGGKNPGGIEEALDKAKDYII